MTPQVSPYRWSCLPTSFAMILDVSVYDVFKAIGHEGSEKWWPSLPEPYCRRGFHIQELIMVSHDLGFSVTRFEPMPRAQGHETAIPQIVPVDINKILKIMDDSEGVLTGNTLAGKPHAVAWHYGSCFDPNGQMYKLENFKMQAFWKIKSFQD